MDLLHLIGRDAMRGRREREMANGVVERAEGIVIHRIVIEADVVIMGTDGDILATQLRVAARQNGDDVPCGRRRLSKRNRAVHRLSQRTRAEAVEWRAE